MAGTHQNGTAATECRPCEAGSFCPMGAAAPLPCASGSYSNSTSLSDASECTACPIGHSCGTASIVPRACSPGNYAPRERMGLCEPCPEGLHQPASGAADCLGRAWLLRSGWVVQKNLAFDTTLESFNATLVKAQIAQLYGVAAAL
eukprot:4532630-Prymnesium_polylepis.1